MNVLLYHTAIFITLIKLSYEQKFKLKYLINHKLYDYQQSQQSQLQLKRYSDNQPKCLDGTIPSYYIYRNNQSFNWIVFFEGGSWCFNHEKCYQRSLTRLGSSKFNTKYLTIDKLYLNYSMLSNNQSINPMTYDWNKVVVRYCDGTSWTSNQIIKYKDKYLYFKGQINRDITMKQLLIIEDMIYAKEIILSGCSAGGLAIYYGIDAMKNIIHHIQSTIYNQSKSLVIGLADSGFFPKNYSYMNQFQSIYQIANMSSGMNHYCLQYIQNNNTIICNISNGNTCKDKDYTECLYAETLMKYIHTPIFTMQSKYDNWQIVMLLQSTNPVLINDFSNTYLINIIQTFSALPAYTSSSSSSSYVSMFGVYIDSCRHHCYSCYQLNYGKQNRFWFDGFDNETVVDFFDGNINPFYAFYLWYIQIAKSNYNSSNHISSDDDIDNVIEIPSDRINITTPTYITNITLDNYLQQLHHVNNYQWFIQNTYNPNQCLCDYSILSHTTKS